MPIPTADTRILVVDDQQDNAESLARVLEAMGCTARFTTQPLKALAQIENFLPHVVLLDIGMPDLDGYQLASMIRSKFPHGVIRIVAVTAYARDEDLSRTAGFDAHLLKPVSPRVLEHTLKRLLA